MSSCRQPTPKLLRQPHGDIVAVAVLVTAMVCTVGAVRLAAQESDQIRINVRLGPFASRAEAEPTLAALEAERIEFYLLPQAPGGMVEISVGVFGIPGNAQSMVERIEALGLGPVRSVTLAGSPAPGAAEATEAAQPEESSPPAPPAPAPQQPTLFEVRYGWFPDREAAVDTYRDLERAGYSPRILVFRASARSTIGLRRVADADTAQREVALLAERGFPNGRVHAVSADEAEDRRLSEEAQPGSPAPVLEEPTPAVAEAAPPAVAAEMVVGEGAMQVDRASPTDVVAAPAPGDATTSWTAPAVSPDTPRDAPYRLSLGDALAYALAHSPELQNQNLQVALSESDLQRAWGLVQPKIIFQHQSARNDPDTVEYYNRLPDGANLLLEQLGLPPTVPPFYYETSHLTQLILTQNLFSGGANRFRISGARAHRDATESQREDQTAETLMRVQQAFFDLARQAEVVSLRQDSLARAERSLESVQRRLSLGLVARAEVLRWKVQVSGERVLLIEARNIYEVGLERFKRLIGYPPGQPLELAFLSDQQVDALMTEGTRALVEDTATGDQWWIEDHPAVIAARSDAEAARLARRAAASDFWPTLDLDGAVGYLENDTLALDEFMQWSARLRVTFPLWDGGVRTQNRATARTNEDLAELQLKVVRDELFVQDRSVIADLRADLAALEEARAAVEQARETMESVSNKAALGLADYIQRIDAQVILTQSEVVETSARYQFVIDLLRWWRVRDPARLQTGALP